MKNYANSDKRKRYCLNGIWEFACGNNGLDSLPQTYESVGIKVPSPYNVNGFMPSYYREFCGEKAYVQGGDFRLYPEYPLIGKQLNAECIIAWFKFLPKPLVIAFFCGLKR